MGWRDRYAEAKAVEGYARKVRRTRGVSAKVNAGRSIPDAPAPHGCGRACGHPDSPSSCPSTVRGGVCPCRYC